MKSRIVTLTLNPSIDRTLSVPALHPGAIHRATAVRQDLGGKGINVSRVLSALGTPSRIVALLAGRTGETLRSGLADQGFEVDEILVKGESRQNVTLFDESSSTCTKVNEPGPSVDEEVVANIEASVCEIVRPGDLWALSGSLPPGAPVDLYARLVSHLQSRGARTFVDTSEAALEAALSCSPFCVKPNWEEARGLFRANCAQSPDDLQIVQALRASGSEIVMLTLGAEGLLLAMDRMTLRASPPIVRARSTIGAGDAAMAGLLWGLLEGCEPEQIARRAVACGTAAAMQDGTGVPSADLIGRIMADVRVGPAVSSALPYENGNGNENGNGTGKGSEAEGFDGDVVCATSCWRRAGR